MSATKALMAQLAGIQGGLLKHGADCYAACAAALAQARAEGVAEGEKRERERIARIAEYIQRESEPLEKGDSAVASYFCGKRSAALGILDAISGVSDGR